ncbi:MAG: MFS transporter, partial [Nitrososphaerales archaeon]
LIGLVLLGYSHGVTYPIASTIISTSVQREKLLQANSIYSLIDSVDYLIAAPILGALSDLITVRSTILFTELPVFVTLLGFLAMSRNATPRVASTSPT